MAALQSAYAGLKIAWAYAALITLVYFTFTDQLVQLFASTSDPSFAGVQSYARIMLKISCLYFFFDATYSVLGGILKGAGDTLWTMVVSNPCMWSCALFIYLAKDAISLTPVGAWIVLTCMVFLLGVFYSIRFWRKTWLNRLMIA